MPTNPMNMTLPAVCRSYQSIYQKPAHADLTPMNPGEEQFLLDFLHREYPGRWEFEAQEFVNNGGRAIGLFVAACG